MRVAVSWIAETPLLMDEAACEKRMHDAAKITAAYA
jgi:hypothetical protein